MAFPVRGLQISLQSLCLRRSISTSNCCQGKKNFRKFLLYNKRGMRGFKKKRAECPDPELPLDNRGVRLNGVFVDNKLHVIPEMIPELIVPNLDNFKLKPYVSYKAPDVVQSEFTAKDLFDVVYGQKIYEDFKAGKLDDEGNPLEPSWQEKLTPEEALQKARMTGSDIFTQDCNQVEKV